MVYRLLLGGLRFVAARTRRVPASTSRAVLVVELTRMGDVVAAMKALHRVRDQIQDGPVHIMVDERFAPLIRDLDLGATVHGVAGSTKLLGLVRAIGRARRLNADIALSMSPAKRNAAAVLASGARIKVGYLSYAESLTPFLLETRVETFGGESVSTVVYGKENIELRPLHVLQALGLAPSQDGGMLRLPPSASARPSRPYFVIHPFAAWQFREWSPKNFASLAHMILREMDHDILFICSEEEEDSLEGLRKNFPEQPRVSFMASRSLTESAAIIQEASAFIGNDSGPLHLASGLGVPVVGLFGPADPAHTGPRTADAVSLFHRVECSPCSQKRCVRPDNPCIDLIQPHEVMKALRTIVPLPGVKEAARHG